MMRSIIKKLWKIITQVQVLSVFLAFALMVFLSYQFMSEIERNNLIELVENAISHTQSHINADILEPSATLGIVSENIRTMIINGNNFAEISDYLKENSNYIYKDDIMMNYATPFYGYFDIFDGAFYSGAGWIPPDDYQPDTRPWYITAAEAKGNVGVSEPYIDMMTNELTLSFSREIYDNDNKRIGIVCLDILFDRISEHAISTSVTEDSYGILIDKNFNVLAHPNPAYIGLNVIYMNDGPAIIESLMKEGIISERKAWDYNNNESVLFVRQFENGWYLAVLAYADKYYKSVNEIAFILIITGFILALGLSFILLSVVSAKKRAEERTMMMLDTAPVGVTMWDKQINLIDFNMEAARVVGLNTKTEYRQKFQELLPEYQPDGNRSIDVMAEFIVNTFKEGQGNRLWHHNNIKGETIPFDAQAFRIKYKNDYAVIVYCRDLREINSAIEKMREADERTQVMLDATPLCADFWDKNYTIIDCNKEALKLYGFKNKNEYLGKFWELSPEYQPDGRLSEEKARENLDKAFNEGYCRFEWLHRKINGELIPCEVTLVRVEYRNENIVCGYTRDLRELKAMMIKMREADECTQILFDTSPLSCILIDNTLNIIECNQEVTRLFDIPDKKMFIERIHEFWPEYQPSGEVSKDRMNRYINEAFEEGFCRFEWMHQKLNGELIPTEVVHVRVKYRGVYAVASYIRDLREIKAMIAEMKRAEIAEASSKAKSDFLAKMSHEIRTPMNAILGITEIQLQDNSLPLVTKEALERIYNSGDLLLGIINDILDLSKIEAGKLELNKAQYDVASLIHDIAKLNIIRYENKPIDFKVIVNENIPKLLIGDELRIKQILNNLLSNAFKYTQQGSIELSLDIEPYDKAGKVMIVFSVRDTGQGMTEEQIKKLGTKFSRFNQEINRKTEGTGLGMNITRNLVQLMEGNINIESAPGKGSVFTIKLPQGFAEKETIGRELAENLMKLNLRTPAKMRNTQIAQEFMPYGRVLVVDDVETNLYVARGLMAPYGLSIDTALNGFDAIAKIDAGSKYDIIFMDHMMPVMDGIETVKVIRETGYDKPVVALTANALAGQAEMFFKNGFDDFISKPIDVRQLNNILNKYIRDKQPQSILDEARRQKNSIYAAGDHNIIIDSQLAEFFVRDAGKAVSVLEKVIKNNFRREDDIQIIIVNIHAMKSTLSNIGERDLSQEAAKLEQAGLENNTSILLSRLPDFIANLRNVIEKLTPDEDTNNNDSGGTDNFLDKEFLEEKMLVIQAGCAAMDKKTAKEAVAALRQKTWPRSIKEMLSKISEHLLHSEFEEAAEIARKMNFY